MLGDGPNRADAFRSCCTMADPAEQLLLDKRLRITDGRLFVLRLMLPSSGECWDADRICKASAEHGDYIRHNTAYRILRALTDAGLLQREWRPGNSGAKAGYRLAQAKQQRAPQLVCRICARTVPIEDGELRLQLLHLAEHNAMDSGQPLRLMGVCRQH